MIAAAATCEPQLEMEGQMLGNMSSLGERQAPWLTQSLSLSLPIHVSDTAATSQDGSIFWMQGAEGCECEDQYLFFYLSSKGSLK